MKGRGNAGSNPGCADQEENLLKVQDKKNVCKLIRMLVTVERERPLEVDAYTNPTTHPTSESLVA